MELEEAVAQLESQASEGLAVVKLEGRGDKCFCSGADLGVADKVDGAEMCAFMQDVTARISRLSAVTVAVVRGGAYGGGSELSTSTDFRIFSSDAKMRWVHTKMNISPGWGGATRLARLVGKSRALRILCTAQVLTAQECAALGIADAVVEPSNMDAAVAAFVAPILEAQPASIRACKTAVTGAPEFDDLSYGVEAAAFASVWGSQANMEAIRSRAPHKAAPSGGNATVARAAGKT